LLLNFFHKSDMSGTGTATALLLLPSLQTLTTYSTKLWEHLVQYEVSTLMRSISKASKYADRLRSKEFDCRVECVNLIFCL